MDGGEVRAEDAFAIEKLRRGAALHLEALLDLGRLFGQVDVQRHAPIFRVCENDPHRCGLDRAHAVDGGGDAHPIRLLQVVDPPRPPIGVAI